MTESVTSASRLTLSRHYAAPRDLVWSVWTDPKHVAAWWGPFGPDKTSCEIEAVVGGLFAVAMTAPDGSSHPGRGIIREIDPPNRLVIEGDPHAPDACGAGLPPRAIVTVTMEEADAGTLLKLDVVFPSSEDKLAANDSGYTASWDKSFNALGDYIERLSAGYAPEGSFTNQPETQR